MGKNVYSWKFYDPEYEKKFKAFLEALHGDSTQEKLNHFWETYLAPKDLSKTMPDEYFTCPITQQAVKIKELPCLEDPNFQCKNVLCLETLRQKVYSAYRK